MKQRDALSLSCPSGPSWSHGRAVGRHSPRTAPSGASGAEGLHARRVSRAHADDSQPIRSSAGGGPIAAPSSSASGSRVVLTCGIVETDAIKAVPDSNQLEPVDDRPARRSKSSGASRHEDIKARRGATSSTSTRCG